MTPKTTPDDLTDETVACYRESGFVHMPGIIAEDEIAPFYDAIQSFSEGIRGKKTNTRWCATTTCSPSW